jgi:hypothetical protein
MNKILFACLGAIVLAPSCKKGATIDPTAPVAFTGCRIRQVVISPTDTAQRERYDFTYNEDGTVATITTNRSNNPSYITVKKFTYKPGSILVFQKDNSSYTMTDSMSLDAQGKVLITGYKDGYYFNYRTYAYDSLGQVILVTSNQYSSVTSANYLWRNGDMVRSGGFTYDYDSTLYKVGNIKASIKDLLQYGRGILTTRHTYRRYWTDTTSSYNYSYTFDSSGNITQIVEGEPSYRITTDIYYDCM